MAQNHPTTMKLRASWEKDKLCEIEGVIFHMIGDWKSLKIGDNYVAGRNVEIKLLTVKEICKNHGIIRSVENEYAYDLNECYKVEIL